MLAAAIVRQVEIVKETFGLLTVLVPARIGELDENRLLRSGEQHMVAVGAEVAPPWLKTMTLCLRRSYSLGEADTRSLGRGVRFLHWRDDARREQKHGGHRQQKEGKADTNHPFCMRHNSLSFIPAAQTLGGVCSVLP